MAAWPFRSQYIGGLGEKRSSAVNNGVMTRSPRHRPRQFGYILVEQCRREKIQPIFRQALKRGRGIVHRGWLFDDQPYSIFVSNEADFHGSWIKVGNAGFHLSFDLFQRWRNHRSWTRPGFGWQVPSYQAYVVGLDGRRYTYLLMTPTRLIGTVGDMAASYAMSRLSTKQRRTHRRHQLLKQIFPWATPVWLDRNAAAYVPRDQDKPKDWKPVHWNQVVGELVTGRRQRKHEYVPPPPRMGRGKRPWHPRRWKRKPDRDAVLAQLHDLGHADLEAMERAGLRIFDHKDQGQ
jgi:hypothetical protein